MQTDSNKLIEQAEGEVDPELKNKLLLAAIKILTDVDVVSVEVSYALGYSWYLMSEDSRERGEQIRLHLGRVLQSEPRHLYARLYLAHYYFDTAQFFLAQSFLKGFSPQDFANEGQAWRDVKVAELLLGCVLELKNESEITDAVENWLHCANLVSVDDLPCPAEVIAVLQRLIKKST